ncbi:MAG: transcription antitermination factor NusB [Hyphomicrobiales bacterium]|jgi:N utilization substance protein B|nr:transcription antitermination factor NusB [Hyphomicrobiales bacterium]|tara:strand:+ start:471 stop:932 length:462 start_codon:yes stop_codon:yes gene_type:complete
MQNKRKILSITRLVVVQSLYQMDMAGTDIDVILKEYKSRVIFDNKDDKMIKDINLNLYKEILTGVYEKQESIDNQIKIFLDKKWSYGRIDVTLRAILRAAVYELLFAPETPFKVVINEYLNIAQSFYSEKEPEFLNAILDKVAKSNLKITTDG